jgi:hypothetical protein
MSDATECQPLIVAKNNAFNVNGDDADDEELALTITKVNKTTITEDAIDILKLGIPIFISSVSWVGVSEMK